MLKLAGQEDKKQIFQGLDFDNYNINIQYNINIVQFFWFPLSIICATIGIALHNLFSSRKRFLCSELIATGFYKEGDYLFGKSAENVLPADFDNEELFEEVSDVWM